MHSLSLTPLVTPPTFPWVCELPESYSSKENFEITSHPPRICLLPNHLFDTHILVPGACHTVKLIVRPGSHKYDFNCILLYHSSS